MLKRIFNWWKQYNCVHYTKAFDLPLPTKLERDAGFPHPVHCGECGKYLGLA